MGRCLPAHKGRTLAPRVADVQRNTVGYGILRALRERARSAENARERRECAIAAPGQCKGSSPSPNAARLLHVRTPPCAEFTSAPQTIRLRSSVQTTANEAP